MQQFTTESPSPLGQEGDQLFTYSSVLINYIRSITMYPILNAALSILMGGFASLNLLLLIYGFGIRSMPQGLVSITIGNR